MVITAHGMLIQIIMNLNQMQNHIMENLFLFHAANELTFKQELNRLKYLKVIKKVKHSQWGALKFLIPGKVEHQKCFDAIKRVIGREVLLAYTDFNAPFEVHTDASNLQLGAVIYQKYKSSLSIHER